MLAIKPCDRANGAIAPPQRLVERAWVVALSRDRAGSSYNNPFFHRLLRQTFENERSVGSTECIGIVHSHPYRMLPGGIWDIVQVTFGIRLFKIHCAWDDAVGNREATH